MNTETDITDSQTQERSRPRKDLDTVGGFLDSCKDETPILLYFNTNDGIQRIPHILGDPPTVGQLRLNKYLRPLKSNEESATRLPEPATPAGSSGSMNDSRKRNTSKRRKPEYLEYQNNTVNKNCLYSNGDREAVLQTIFRRGVLPQVVVYALGLLVAVWLLAYSNSLTEDGKSSSCSCPS